VSTQVLSEMYRGMQVQTSRTSFAELFINDVYLGLYGLQEKTDDKFQKSRYAIKDTNMYKVGTYKLTYLGDTAEPYQLLNTSSIDKTLQYVIEQDEGNGDWTDFVQLVTALNSSDAVAGEYLQNHFDVAPFLRAIALETISLNNDAYIGGGNNYILNSINNDSPYWEWVAYDFDLAFTNTSDYFAALFGMTGAQLQALRDSGVWYYYGLILPKYIFDPNPYEVTGLGGNPLMDQILRNVPGANATFGEALEDFVKLFIVNQPGKTHLRREAFRNLARPIIARDGLFSIAKISANDYTGLAGFDVESQKLVNWFNTRWAYLTTNFYAYNHGTCDAQGQCVCNDGYFGAACDTFCGANFRQTKTSSWSSNGQQYSQWSVTLNVGASPLYSVQIAVTPNADSFSPWSIDKVSNNLYSIPEYQYTNGAIAAGSSSVTFGYTISSASAATFKLNNNACVPKACSLSVTPTVQSSWTSGQYKYQRVTLNVQNLSSTKASSVTVAIAFGGNSYISDGSNISPSSSTAGKPQENFTCSLFNLAAGSTSTSCGYTVVTPVSFSGTATSVSVASSICL